MTCGLCCGCCSGQDAKMFKRKKWKYLILDEAHMIKNWKSQRWQTLLNFNSKRRLLITGAAQATNTCKCVQTEAKPEITC